MNGSTLELGGLIIAVFTVVVWAVRLEGIVRAHAVKDEVIQDALKAALTRIEAKLDAMSASVGLTGPQGNTGPRGRTGRRGQRGRNAVSR